VNLGNPEVFEIPGFRLALAIASLAEMTPELCTELLTQVRHKRSCGVQPERNFLNHFKPLSVRPELVEGLRESFSATYLD
jgi:hypothetical protein